MPDWRSSAFKLIGKKSLFGKQVCSERCFKHCTNHLCRGDNKHGIGVLVFAASAYCGGSNRCVLRPVHFRIRQGLWRRIQKNDKINL